MSTYSRKSSSSASDARPGSAPSARKSAHGRIAGAGASGGSKPKLKATKRSSLGASSVAPSGRPARPSTGSSARRPASAGKVATGRPALSGRTAATGGRPSASGGLSGRRPAAGTALARRPAMGKPSGGQERRRPAMGKPRERASAAAPTASPRAAAGGTVAGKSKPTLALSRPLLGSGRTADPSSAPKARPSASTGRASAAPTASSAPKRRRGLALPAAGETKAAGSPAVTRAAGRAADGADAKAAGTRIGLPKPSGRMVAVGAGVVAALAALSLVVLLVLSHLPVFVIEGIDAQASEHVSAESIAKLAGVGEGTTLLNVDVRAVQDGVRRNPWVKGVHVSREFPDRLGISVEERSVQAIVVIGSGSSVWALGDDGCWIEPVQVSVGGGGDVTEAALKVAQDYGCILIAQVPSTVNPAQSSPTTDDVILDVLTYQRELSQSLTSQAQQYNAASEGSISLVLTSGLEVSLGAPTEIDAKQAALQQIMSTYEGKLTYVNVRVPSKPSYRKVSM